MLLDAARQAGVEPVIAEGDGAFYAPKLDFIVKDAIGREWTCGTLQLDYVLPERLDAEYVAEDGSKQRPVMLHRAILGSFERFIGIMIENYAGAFPLWLAPGAGGGGDDHLRRRRLCRGSGGRALRAAGLRVETDLRNEKINYKIREHTLAKAPVIAVVGRREAEEGKVALRRFGSDGQQILSLDEAVRLLSRRSHAAGSEAGGAVHSSPPRAAGEGDRPKGGGGGEPQSPARAVGQERVQHEVFRIELEARPLHHAARGPPPPHASLRGRSLNA